MPWPTLGACFPARGFLLESSASRGTVFLTCAPQRQLSVFLGGDGITRRGRHEFGADRTWDCLPQNLVDRR